MKGSEIYLRAAKSTYGGKNRFSCCEIDRAARTTFSWQRKKYTSIFCPTNSFEHSVWGERWADNDTDRKSCRVLALLFMHQIALDEERKGNGKA